MSADRTIAVIGGGLAGAKAAEAARDAGHDGRIVLLGEEPGVPYERPPLSKDVLRGDKDVSVTHVHPDGFYDDRSIELVRGRVVGLDVEARRIAVDGAEPITFDSAVIATGSEPRRLDIPGSDLDGVHYLRTIEDSERLGTAIRSAGRVAVVGAGWIGSEVAASARQMGAEVVLIDPTPVPLQRVLGDTIGAVFAALHSEHGVQLRPGNGVTELRGSGSVEEVVLSDGRVEPADVVVVGVGVTPPGRAGRRRRAAPRQRDPRRRAPGDQRAGHLRRG